MTILPSCTNFTNKNVLIIGLGISGRSAAEFLLQCKAHVCGTDHNQDLLSHNPHIATLQAKGMQIVHDEEAIDIAPFDCIVVSPGISPLHRLYAAASAAGKEIIGEVELACRYIKESCHKFLAITGTNGKTSVTLLVAHILNQSGKKARALGNMGVPLTSECMQKSLIEKEIIVVELSSYQLETLQSTIIDAAVILNITPDHLDRYSTMQEYAAAKAHIATCMKPGGTLYVEERCMQEFGALLKGFATKIYGYSSTCDLSTNLRHLTYNNSFLCQLPSAYQGCISHDLENLMAAYALCREMDVSTESFLQALATWKKPPHRLEFVRTLDNVSYYDDSKGTNIDAVIRATHSLPGNILLIAGGVDKGAAYTPWIDAFKNKVRCILAIGEAAKKIENDLAHALPIILCESLESAIAYAHCVAKSGECVLLSPGCASFDMFRDYAHRGEEFKRIVNAINRK